MLPHLTANQRNLILIIVIGLAVRYVLGVVFTYPRDIGSWILNSENFLMGEGLYGLPGHYYTPVWGYIMAIVTAFCGFLGVPISQFNEAFVGGEAVVPWEAVLPTMEYSLLVKTVLFAFDLLVGYVIYRIVMHVRGDERLAVISFGIWFLCPLTIIISSMRIMFENLEILLILCSLLMMLLDRPRLSGVMMGMSLLVKPYGLFLGILMIGYAYAKTGSLRHTLTYVFWTVVSMVVLMAPVVATGGLDDAMIWLTARSDDISTGYNMSLLLMPVLLAVSVVVAYLFARHRCTDFRMLMIAGTMITAGTLVFAGNVQYYLVILPFVILLFTRLSVLFYIVMIGMSVLAGLSYLEWSTELYVQEQYWGYGFVEGLRALEWDSSYNWLKSLCGGLGVLIPAAILARRRWLPNEG